MPERYDQGEILKHEITPEGYLRCIAKVARIGIQDYYNEDGSLRRELRPPAEVSDPESLASYGLKPHTLLHPSEFVDSKNSRKYQTGSTDSRVWYDKGFVHVAVNVNDEYAKQEILSGRAREISCGYTCDVVNTPGVWNGQKYDAIQTNIRINHVASVPRGRAGADVKAYVDSYEYIDNKKITVYTIKKDMAVSWKHGSKKMSGTVVGTYPERIERTINGEMVEKAGTQENPAIEIELPDGGTVIKLASEVEMMSEDMSNKKEDALTSRISTLEAMLNDKRNNIAELSKENSTLSDEKARLTADAKSALEEVNRLRAGRNDVVAAEVTARMDAWKRAEHLLPKTMTENPDPKMTATNIMRAAIENSSPDTKLDGVTDDYIKGCFETLLAQPKVDKTQKIKRAIANAYEGVNRGDAETKRNEARRKDEELWMTTN